MTNFSQAIDFITPKPFGKLMRGGSPDRRRNSQAHPIADIDPVTALQNRDSFMQVACQKLSQSGVLMRLDVDGFKAINDNGMGDLCMMALAQRFRELTRPTDVVGRLDERSFAIFLTGAGIEHAGDIADRLSAGAMVMNDNGTTSVTASIGAVFSNGNTSLDYVLDYVDVALQRAQCLGSARVIMDVVPRAA